MTVWTPERVRAAHPDAFARVRAACCNHSSSTVDLDAHAAQIVLVTESFRAARVAGNARLAARLLADARRAS